MKEKKQTFTVLFWIRKGRTSENMAPLHCRVTISGQRYEIPMNIYLPLSSWSATAQKALGKSDASKEVNRYIEDLKMAIDETLTRIRNKNYLLNIENFKLMFNAQDNEYSTISKLFEYHEIIETKKLKKTLLPVTELPETISLITSKTSIIQLIMIFPPLTKHLLMSSSHTCKDSTEKTTRNYAPLTEH